MKKTVLLGIVAAFVLAPVATAATYQGDTYFTFSGMWERTKLRSEQGGGTSNFTEINFGVEYFLSKELSVGPRLGYARASGGSRMYDIGVDAKYHFMTDSQFVPYVGGLVDYRCFKNDGTADGMTYGPLAGVKMFVTENTHVFAQYEYRRFTGDLKSALKDQHAILFGIAFKFN